MNNYIVYGIENLVNGKWYIGQTSNYDNRQSEHLRRLRTGKHHSALLQLDYDNDNLDLQWHVLDSADTLNVALQLEEKWISHFDAYWNGYNGKPSDFDRPDLSVPCEWNGIQYDSISQAANILGVNVITLWDRLNKGHTKDSDLQWQPVPVVWNEVQYESLNEASRQTGISATSLKRYIDKGYDCDNDLPKKQKFPKSRKLIWDDIEYPSINEAARQLEIDDSTFYYWYRVKGYTRFSDLPKSSKYYRED